MVMFRDFTRRKARALGLVGEVWNEKDGTVRVVAEGEESVLNGFLDELRKGPPLAKVERVEETRSDPSGTFDSFTIIYKNIWDRI